MHSAVNCICFKVWGVLQDWHGQVVSQDSHNNSQSKSLVYSLQSQRPTLTSASFSLHTGINGGLESRPQLWKQLQKTHPTFGSCMVLQNRFHKLNRCKAASPLDSDQFDGEHRSQSYISLFKHRGPWGPSSLLPCTLCNCKCLVRGHAKHRKSDFMAPFILLRVIHKMKGNKNSRLFASTWQPVQVQGYRK